MANKKQNQIEISESERCFATLVASGLWTQAQAHRLSYPESKLKDDSQRRQMASGVNQKPQVIAYKRLALLSFISEQNKAASGGLPKNTERTGNRNKDDIRALMNENIDRELDPAKQNKLLLDLANLDSMRGSDTGDNEDRIRYYLPLVCYQCKLFNDAKKEK